MYTQKNSLVELKNISLIKNNKTILRDISLDIYEDEIVSIIGSNGAGKTTLLDIILGLQKPTTGEIKIHTKNIGYVPQKFLFDSTYPLTIEDFFGLYNIQRREDSMYLPIIRKRAIDKMFKQNMGSLSGGELQKILILLAIMKEPDILFLDEATAGVDAIGEKDFYEFLEWIHKEKHISIVLVSHNIHTVFSYSNRVICLDKTIGCTGKPEHIQNNSDFAKIFGDFSRPYIHKKHGGIV